MLAPFAGSLLALLAAACGKAAVTGVPAATGSAVGQSIAAVNAGPARWFPLASATEPRFEEEDADGSSRVVDHGLRWVEYTDGRVERASDLLPEGGALSLLRLPARLGGGFVFHTSFEGTTRLYVARTFTGTLAPLVRLPFEVSQLAAGFDRLYAVSTRSRAVVGIDVKTGAVTGEVALPRAASYGGMAFSDGWVGAIETDVRGVLVTFDAGAIWHPVPVATTTPGVFEQGGRIILGTTRGAFALSPSGELDRIDAPGNEAAFRDLMRPFTITDDETAPLDEPRTPRSQGPLRARALETAVLRGIPDSAGTALIVSDGVLARVSLDDGKLLATSERVVPDGTVCTGVRLYGGIGFVCGSDGGATSVHAYVPPLGLQKVLAFDEPRAVLAGGGGALAIGGGCAPTSHDPSAVCIVARSGALHEIQVRGDTGAGRVVALADGRAAVVVPPRLGASGSLSVVEVDGRTHQVALELSALPEGIRDLATRGLWLHGFVEVGDKLSGWIVGSGPFVGVQIGFDGKVSAGVIRANVERANLAGPYGLARDLHGGARETVDGGIHWAEVGMPSDDDVADAPERARGCSPVGCTTGTWMRVGWGGKGPSGDLTPAAEPRRAKLEASTFVSWGLECAPTGETEGPHDVRNEASAARRSGGAYVADEYEPRARSQTALSRSTDELESSGWRTFMGALPPKRASGELGFDFGTEDQTVQVRGYAWGAREAAWDRSGSWLLRGVDRFSVKKAVWSTAVSRTPWADAALAADAFGSDPSHRISSEWSVVMDPIDDAGLLFVRTTASTSLAVVEKERALVVVKNTDEFQLDRPAGAVKAGGRWYLGEIPGARALQVLALDGATLSLVANFPRYGDDPFARVVRTTRGDAVGVWVIARGQQGTRSGGDTWFVHPIDPATGKAGDPLVVTHQELSKPPRVCESQEDGWVLLHEVSSSVGKVDIVDSSESPAVGHLEAKLVAGPGGLCIDTLAAQVDGDPPKTLTMQAAASSRAHRPRATVPLVLTDRATDRRWGLRCSP